MQQEKVKTYKREVAMGMLLFLASLFIAGIFKQSAREIAEFLTTPIFAFAGGAFAIDAVFKQGGFTRD